MQDEEFQSRLNAAVLAAFDALLMEIGRETPYAIALFTCESAMSIGFAATTEEHLAIREVDVDDAAYYRWSTAEWRNEGWRADLFESFTRSPHAETGDFDTHFDGILEAMQMALANRRSKRALQLEDVTLFATVTDDDVAEDVENRTAKVLNPPSVAERFHRRYD